MAPNVATRVVFKNILFATDFSEVSQRALLHALAIARRYDAQFSVVHVAAPETQTPIPMEPVPLELDGQKKRAAQSPARFEDFEPLHRYPHQTILKQGNPWLEISAIIADKGIDLIVLGTHGRGPIGKVLLGSVAEEVLRHATCPVLTVGPAVVPSLVEHEQLSRVLFATDFSEGSLHAFPYALSIAEEDNAELILMHVMQQLQPIPVGYSKELLADYRQRLWQLVPDDANLWCRPQVVVEIGATAETIVRTAHDRQVDLIAMGVHRSGPIASHLPWTLVHSVVRHARCPVLTTR